MRLNNIGEVNILNTSKNRYKVKAGNPMQLGARKTKDGINFAVMLPDRKKESASVVLYEKGTTEVISEIPFTEEMTFGKVCSMCIQGVNANAFDYNYKIGDRVMTDPYAALVNGTKVFGENTAESKTSSVYSDRFNWDNDIKPGTDFSDTIIYRLHVRGFTKNRYSKTRRKGTFAGIVDKIDYLKELGITMVELMPAYDFNEKPLKGDKVNYWGYCDADYFMPKVSYSASGDGKGAIREFKTMVKKLHAANIEVCMEFYFNRNITPAFMIDCFRYWVINYHIDGIHCNLDEDIRGAISADPYLADTKIISYGFSNDEFSDKKHLGEYNRAFMNTARKFLKGDEGQVMDMAYRIRYNKSFAQAINYFSTNDTFTMMDMVSYDGKHNQDNGEYNRDGIEDNNSWNCGYEGYTKKKVVNELRQRQLKNAYAMLMFSQGTPLIYAGDEFGNSANGNNNPYCQDNDVSYLDWRLTEKNKWLLDYVKWLIDFRKSHKILHMENPMEGNDYRSLGMPDVSFHSDRTWILQFDVLSRQFAFMVYGKYTTVCKLPEEPSLYIAFNTHWEEKTLGLPTAGKNRDWKQVMSTEPGYNADIISEKNKMARTVKIPPRSVLVLESYEIEEKEENKPEKKQVRKKLTRSRRK